MQRLPMRGDAGVTAPILARRRVLKGAAAGVLLGITSRSVEARPPAPALKSAAPSPVGTCLTSHDLDDAVRRSLTLRHFNQITPEWEMKMEEILTDDGAYRFDAADRIARFCAQYGLRLHGTTLAWYAQDPIAFRRLAADRDRFEASYRGYISTVVGRYRGLARGWDVVNEAVAEDGHGYRGGVWERALGPDYARIAFEACRDADPGAVRFLNDYNLESNPIKLDAFQRLLERLLKQGAPVNGIGTQTHVSASAPPGQSGRAIRTLARFGLPIHVSELDVSTRREGRMSSPLVDPLNRQARVVAEIAEAFLDLPPPQRYAFTVWGVRDSDSWLRRPPNQGDGRDQPLLFDDSGEPKPAFEALYTTFTKNRRV